MLSPLSDELKHPRAVFAENKSCLFFMETFKILLSTRLPQELFLCFATRVFS
uniref:Uncharacterized protein n=1 Tax=Rhizophora mucronata TaxID=61149 RepID=A0A2P2KW57_RHIMU